MQTARLSLSALQEIGDVSDEGLVLYDIKEQKTIYVNPVAKDVTGTNNGGSIADIRRLLDAVIPDDRDLVIRQFHLALTQAAPREFTVHLLAKRKEMTVSCKTYLVFERAVMVVIFRDITLERQHESYLVEFGARKNTVLDTLGHTISGALTLMQNLSVEAAKYIEASAHENLRKYLALIDENIRHSLEIIGGLMKHEHLKSPDIFVKKSRFNLVEVVSYVYDELRHGYGERKFVFNAPSDVIYVETDEVKVLQIVNNLTSNAIKFSPERKPITITIAENSDAVIVGVRDEGIGIPETLKPMIFQRLAGKGRKGLNGEGSMGLGLWICKNLIDLMGGEIWFESMEGEGSAFYFSLPKEDRKFNT